MLGCASALLIITLTLATGCGTDPDEPPICDELRRDFPADIHRDIDLLFVIDDSPSMAEERASLLNNFDRFIAVLENVEGGLPNLHLGVVSTDLGSRGDPVGDCVGDGGGGELRAEPRGECTPPNGRFISYQEFANGDVERNYEGTLAETFACIADLGSTGCGVEQPLEAMYRALNGSVAANAGFMRPDAFLMVVFIVDEDDCSIDDPSFFTQGPVEPEAESAFRCFADGVRCEPDEPGVPGVKAGCEPRPDPTWLHDVDRYVDFLKGLKEEPGLVLVSGIIGGSAAIEVVDNGGNPALAPACTSVSGSATPSPRLSHFLEQFPQRYTTTSLCEEDLSDAFVLFADLLLEILSVPCMDAEIDLDPDTPGVQYQCRVSQVRYPGSEEGEVPMTECTAVPAPETERPCWYLAEDPACQGIGSGLILGVEYSQESIPSGASIVTRCDIDCVTE